MGCITAGLLFTAASQSKFGGGFVETFWFLYFVGSIQAKNNSKIVSLSFESDARRKESVIATCLNEAPSAHVLGTLQHPWLKL